LLTGCWVRPEVKEFFQNLFEERYGNLAACVAVAAVLPDLNPICYNIWPHLNKKGKLQLLNAKYTLNLSHLSTNRHSSLTKNLIKVIKSSKLLNMSKIPEFSEFCEIIWPPLPLEDRKQILIAQFPGSFYRNLCENFFGETALHTALASHDFLINDHWMEKIWPELNSKGRHVFLSKAISDWRKAYFFEGISVHAIGQLEKISYDMLAAELEGKLIGVLWKFLSEEERTWWTENGYAVEEED